MFSLKSIGVGSCTGLGFTNEMETTSNVALGKQEYFKQHSILWIMVLVKLTLDFFKFQLTAFQKSVLL